MATYSIGSAGGRTWATLEAAEAASWNGDTGSVVLELYKDSDFTGATNITTGGPNDVVIKPAAGHECGGVKNAGVRFLGVSIIWNNGVDSWFQDFEIDVNNGTPGTNGVLQITTGNTTLKHVRRMLVHDVDGNSSGLRNGIHITAKNAFVNNCVVFNIGNSGSGPASGISANSSGTQEISIWNCTVDNCKTDGIIIFDNSNKNVINCVVTRCGGSCFTPSSPSNATMNHNASSDTTASGTGALTSVTYTDLFTTPGTIYTIKDTAAVIYWANNAANDGGTTNERHLTIDRYNRDTGGDTWSYGAYQGQGLAASSTILKHMMQMAV